MRPETLEVVCSFDPAIDTEQMTQSQMLAYLGSRDPKLLKLGTAMPTKFFLREAPNALWEPYVMRGETEDERAKRAFQVCVTKVQMVYQNDGTHLPELTPTGRMGDHVIWSSEEMNARFSPAERLEVGTVAWQHSFLPRRVTIGGGLRLPLSLLDLLIHRTFRNADASPSDAAPSSEKPSGSTTSKTGATDPKSGVTAAASGSAIDVIATATSRSDEYTEVRRTA